MKQIDDCKVLLSEIFAAAIQLPDALRQRDEALQQLKESRVSLDRIRQTNDDLTRQNIALQAEIDANEELPTTKAKRIAELESRIADQQAKLQKLKR